MPKSLKLCPRGDGGRGRGGVESHHYADFCFAHGATQPPPPAFVSTVKIKQAGFTEVWDTEESFVHWIRVLQDRRVLPPAG